MRILHDATRMDCKDRLPSAEPDRSILSRPPSQESSSKNLEGRPQRQYKAMTQYRLVYAEVGYPLHDVPSIDKAFHAINDVLLGDKISSCAQYCLR